AHSLEAADVLLLARALLLELGDLLLGDLLVGAIFAHALERPEPLEAALDRAEVRQGAPQPAVDDVVLASPLGFFSDDSLGLPLGTYEKDVSSTSDGLVHEVEGPLEELSRLVQIDDVDAVARSVDVRAHRRIPALRLVPEVDTRVEEVPDRQ